MPNQRSGLRTTVRLYDTVVEQRVDWCPRVLGRGIWRSAGEMVPGSGTEGVARFRWTRAGSIDFECIESNIVQRSEARWDWSGPEGASVSFDVIPMKRATRRSQEQLGDLALLVMVLTLMVGVAQLNFLFRAVVGERVASTESMTPSPELIARLLQQELNGADAGAVAHVQRQRHVRPSKSFYLPAGSQGPIDRVEGGEVQGETRRRAPPSEAEGNAETSGENVPQKREVPSFAVAPTGLPLVTVEVEPVADVGGERGLPASVEQFIGWGFHDWMDTSNPETAEIVEQLTLARELMRLNPDEPYAILTVAYFAYLSENYTLCQDLYRRYTDLYPEDAAGWNNLALTHKRSGEYQQEERLYRVALRLEPGNSNTQNNLAVNLAHQGRFAEAETLMDGLRASPSERPYANLHRAKIAAAQGKDRRAIRYLRRALEDVDEMDTLHHIEFRQDIRLDPALARLRSKPRVQRLLEDVYGGDSPIRLGQSPLRPRGSADG